MSHCPLYLLSFDASSHAIGYAYFSHNRLVNCGAVLSSKDMVQVRIRHLMDQIKEVFPRIAPDVVCVMEWSEGRPIAFLKEKGRSAQSSVPLAHAQGALFFWLIGQGLEVTCIGEGEWTKRRGRYMSKAARAQEVMFRYPEHHETLVIDARAERYDAADAVGLGDWYIGEMLSKDLGEKY
jgi:Holliday junction resolvasome RuvABC endonuclease subunit